MLSKLGASVDTVDDGLQAANAVATATALYGQDSSNVDWTGNEKPYDVVLMDCQV
jgi:CheY-like chemotaxis protein